MPFHLPRIRRQDLRNAKFLLHRNWLKKALCLLLGTALVLAGKIQVSALCIVGYVNIQLTNGDNFINLQFRPDDHPTYKISEVFGTNAPDRTKVYLWDVTNQVFTTPSVYSAPSKTWSIDYLLPTGPGFVVQGTQAWTLTTVGGVCDGSFTNLVAGTNKWSFLGLTIPVSLSLSAATFPILDGANVLLFNKTNQAFSDAVTAFAGYGWFDPTGHADTGGPVLAVSQPFFIQNLGPDTKWIFHYVIPSFSAPAASSTTAEIQSLNIDSGLTTLRLHNRENARYAVQFSTDGMVWTTVATNRSGNVWSEKSREGSRGYYRLTAS
jgi:hypothetical protein